LMSYSMVVLLAEDDLPIQRLVSALLSADGFTVLATDDGEAALEASRGYPGDISLLLTDLDMPKMGGVELCKRITAERTGIKVLMMSGDPGGRELACPNGISFIDKPFTISTLQDSIEALLGPKTEVVRPNGIRGRISDEELEKFVLSFPVERN
jgi:two-component system cell cycle sensor histidine kinase/response regulator CckA